MSNEVSIFRSGHSVAGAPQGVDEITRRLLGGNTLNLKRISIRGGKWRVMSNGEQVALSNKDTLDIVVLNAAPHVSRYWYNQGYDGKNTGAPDCWSNDGTRPDPRSKSPQSNICEGCPKNIAGSGTNGSGRACRYARRLAVALASENGISDDVYQLQLPPTSLFGKAKDENHMGLDAYVRHLAAYNFSITGVITEMRFDPNAESPRIYFRGVDQLDAEQRAFVTEQGQSPEALAAIAFNPGTIDSGAVKTPEPAAAPAPAPLFRDRPVEVEKPQPAPAVVAPKVPVVEEETDISDEFVQAAPVKEEEPVVRRNTQKAATPPPKIDIANLLDEWDLDDE